MPVEFQDYKIIDAPSMLSRTVKKQDPLDPSKWIRDDDWYEDIREIYTSLVSFLRDHNLLKGHSNYDPIDNAVINYSDLNDLGKIFLKSGAIDKWRASFDRPGSKKAFSDVRYLEKALRAISGTA